MGKVISIWIIFDFLCLIKIYVVMIRLDLSVFCYKIKIDFKIIIRYDSFVK